MKNVSALFLAFSILLCSHSAYSYDNRSAAGVLGIVGIIAFIIYYNFYGSSGSQSTQDTPNKINLALINQINKSIIDSHESTEEDDTKKVKDQPQEKPTTLDQKIEKDNQDNKEQLKDTIDTNSEKIEINASHNNDSLPSSSESATTFYSTFKETLKANFGNMDSFVKENIDIMHG